jgi:hypothetical protein
MKSILRTSLVLVLMLSLHGPDAVARGTFSITLAESGEVILSDQHIAAYDWNRHSLVLTDEGLRRWQSFVPYNDAFDPPIPLISELFGKEFVLTIGGSEMYRGRFWTMLSSLLVSGVKIYDTNVVPENRLSISFDRRDGEPEEDPRSRTQIQRYFMRHGKLILDE